MGYIKRTPLSEFRAQNRGGVGSKGTETRDADFVEHIYPCLLYTSLSISIGLKTNGKLMEARTASPKSPLLNTNGFLLYTSDAIQRKGCLLYTSSLNHLRQNCDNVNAHITLF